MNLLKVEFVLVAILMSKCKGETVLPDDCKLTYSRITCSFSVPKYIPENVTELYVSQYSEFNIPLEQFSDPSWKNITTIDIVTDSRIEILPYNFRYVQNLQRLGIHHRGKVYLSPNSFSGLPNLVHLDISNCTYLSADTVYVAIKDSADSLGNLKFLNLDYLFSASDRIVNIKYILKILKILRIESLSMRWTNILYLDNEGFEFQSALKMIDLSGMQLLAGTLESLTHGMLYAFSKLEVLKINEYQIPVTEFPSHGIILSDELSSPAGGDCPVFQWVFNQLQILEINRIAPGDIIIDRYVLDYSNCVNISSLLTIHLSQNRIRKLNATVTMPRSVLKELDISSNSTYYISPRVLCDLVSLKTLLLSDNDLGKMEYMSEFEELVSKQPILEILDMSKNRLSRIPHDMFLFNTKLKVLDLSRNSLETIAFSLEKMTSLQTLQLQNNKILFLDKYSMFQIDSLLRITIPRNFSVIIELFNNPFQCTCESLQFLYWVVHEVKQKVNVNNTFTCQLDDVVIDIDQSAIDQSKQFCKSNILTVEFYILLFVYTLTVIVLLLLLLQCKHVGMQKNRLAKERHAFIQKMKARETPEKHLVFLSENCDACVPEDEDVLLHVIEKVKEELASDIGNGFCILKTDNMNGQLGVYRDEAASKFIADSCVVVMLVSITDPDNRFFRTDMELAKFHNKPIILLVKKVKDGLKLTAEYIHMYPTVELERQKDAWQPSAGWKHLCITILDLAVKGQRKRQKLHVVNL